MSGYKINNGKLILRCNNLKQFRAVVNGKLTVTDVDSIKIKRVDGRLAVVTEVPPVENNGKRLGRRPLRFKIINGKLTRIKD